ncbi:hypothetical protein Tco_0702355 [Tanacetum coccineum]|uniref:Uncharacterized protein n=1 Tax=Tanacetum coccineum TaxID=301880 RepID=A0ABQ4XVQ6_9ASTR
MAASAITISSNSSDESVGSLPSRVILFGDIPTVIPSTSVVAPETSTIAPVISSVAHVVETTLVASPTGLCGLVPYPGSNSDSPDEMSSPEHISPLPAISPFLCTDSSEAPDLLIDHLRRTLMLLPLLVGGACLSLDSSPVHTLGLDASDQAHSRYSTRDWVLLYWVVFCWVEVTPPSDGGRVSDPAAELVRPYRLLLDQKGVTVHFDSFDLITFRDLQ